MSLPTLNTKHGGGPLAITAAHTFQLRISLTVHDFSRHFVLCDDEILGDRVFFLLVTHFGGKNRELGISRGHQGTGGKQNGLGVDQRCKLAKSVAVVSGDRPNTNPLHQQPTLQGYQFNIFTRDETTT